MRGQQARHAGTDHGDAKRAVGGELGTSPRRRPKISRSVAELLEQQRDVVVGGVAGHHPGHDRADGIGRRSRSRGPAGVAHLDQGTDGDLACVSLMVGTPTSLRLVVLGRIQVQPVEKVGRAEVVSEGREQRRQVGDGDHLGELLVGALHVRRLDSRGHVRTVGRRYPWLPPCEPHLPNCCPPVAHCSPTARPAPTTSSVVSARATRRSSGTSTIPTRCAPCTSSSSTPAPTSS